MRLLRDIFLAILVMACFLVLVEVGMRMSGLRYSASLYHPDRDLGFALRPNAAGWSVEERDQFIRINSQGMRDREHAIARPEGVIRIAVLGDSYAEAAQVQVEAAFWSVMERKLNDALKASDKRVEVLNFGVAGYGLPQEYELLQKRVWQYDPQIVVLTGNLHSLILRCNRKFAMPRETEGPVPYFWRRDGELTLDATYLQQQRDFIGQSRSGIMIANLTNVSRVLALINGARREWAADLSALERRLRGVKEASFFEIATLEDTVLRGPAMGPNFDEAWDISQDLLRKCQEDVSRHHAEFWLFLMDMPPQVDPDRQRRLIKAQTLGIDDLFATDRLIDDFARRADIKHAWLSPEMLAYAEQNHVVLHGFGGGRINFGHWNEIGHQVAGDLMAQQLLSCSDVVGVNRESVRGQMPTICNDVASSQDKGRRL